MHDNNSINNKLNIKETQKSLRGAFYFFLLIIFLFSSTTLAMAEKFQTVLNIECSGEFFVVQGRPYNKNEAGSSSIELQYLYREKPLQSMNYESFYKNLDFFLMKDKEQTRIFGLQLITDGASHFGGSYEAGHTLYIPPTDFLKSDFENLSLCIEKNSSKIKEGFKNAIIKGSFLFGLMETKAKVGLNGIARLIYANSPILQIYGHHPFILIERSGSVSIRTNFTANNSSESLIIGSVLPRADLKKVLRVSSYFMFQGTKRIFSDFTALENSNGQMLKEIYEFEFQ